MQALTFLLWLWALPAMAQHFPEWPYKDYDSSHFEKVSEDKIKSLGQVVALQRKGDYGLAQEILAGVMQDAGFKIQKIPQGNLNILEVPKSFQMSVPLNAVLSKGGHVAIKIRPDKFNTAHADEKGVNMDLNRFVNNLAGNTLGVIPHEATHFFHLNGYWRDEKRDLTDNLLMDLIVTNDENLNIYRNGFYITEIECHLGDALLFQVEDHSQTSVLNSMGKFSLAYIMAAKLHAAAVRGLKNVEADLGGYVDFVLSSVQISLRKPQYTELSIPYRDELGSVSYLTYQRPLIPFDKNVLLEIITEHKEYAEQIMGEIKELSGIETREQALKIFKEQI